MNPILISSPVRRSGTTLLQRLLCSSSNALIFGESCANDFNLLTNLLVSKQMVLGQNKEWRNTQLASVLNKETNDWIPDLMPDIDNYLEAVKKASFSILGHYKEFAKENQCSVWGAKLPEWNIFSLVQTHDFFPESKVIYLVRNLPDCLRSAKSIGMVHRLEDMQYFCNTWKQNKEFASQRLKGERVLHINYEDLISNPKEIIEKIALFTGAKGIDLSVIESKINTYIDLGRPLELGYLKPASLTDEELNLVNMFTEK